jgi:uncharacterized membrane protein YphA (DoxX/SURF4 family)
MESQMNRAKPHAALVIALWLAQVVVFAMFTLIGSIKLLTPISQLSTMMKWTGDYPELFVRLIGVIDILGGLGMLLPALTRIRPQLGVAAAWGCTILQVCAIIFHMSRGEAVQTPLNFALLALSGFVLWGRSAKVPIAPRG